MERGVPRGEVLSRTYKMRRAKISFLFAPGRRREHIAALLCVRSKDVR